VVDALCILVLMADNFITEIAIPYREDMHYQSSIRSARLSIIVILELGGPGAVTSTKNGYGTRYRILIPRPGLPSCIEISNRAMVYMRLHFLNGLRLTRNSAIEYDRSRQTRPRQALGFWPCNAL
jgi:hypothetical protein